jgi:polyferredoxin
MAIITGKKIRKKMETIPKVIENKETKSKGPDIMWRAVLLRVLYYLFFIFIFVMAFFIFLKLVNFYFYIPSLENFLNSFISSLNI